MGTVSDNVMITGKPGTDRVGVIMPTSVWLPREMAKWQEPGAQGDSRSTRQSPPAF